ncbi:hypothetical protein [Idiomarina sp.]|uniref:hypothetical protein n=1 Tax=Idiomarina sp. TaxID=1874361 RepID=UPI00258628BD|nr:hypothetical protein [Idiomarina sp.]
MSSKHTNWTEEMDAYLVAHYHLKAASQIATELYTSKQAVLRRARKLGVKRKADSDSAERPTYSAEEDAYIKGFIEQQGIEAVAEHLNRSVNAIRKRAQRLGVSTASHMKALTEKEQQYLEQNLGVKSYAEIGQVLNRNADAVRWHARKLRP